VGQPISRVVPGLIALLVPERSDRRGGRSGRLGRDWHVERALQVRADRRGRPLARTTTRRRFSRPWLSREGRGSRGVGVHRSFREGPDWPVRPRPSLDASCSAPTATAVSYARWFEVELLPCWVSERSLDRRADVLPRFAVLASTAHGAEVRRRRQAGLEAMPSSAEMEGYLRTIARTKFAVSRKNSLQEVPTRVKYSDGGISRRGRSRASVPIVVALGAQHPRLRLFQGRGST